MRPLELKIRNFRSYAGEHTFDFSERSLVAIVGPIGSGKSSILDAIVFALYGRTPRIPTATKTLINQRAADAAVSLRFEVEGELWEATRSIRIKGASRHALYRYDDPDGDPVEKLTLETDVNERMVALLGLDYAAFERSVLLAQGRFAEFLQARPADRDRVLKGVFGHDRVDRMKALAKERRDESELELARLRIRLERVDETKQRIVVNKEEATVAGERLATLEKAAQRDKELRHQLELAHARAETAKKRLAMLEEQTSRLPDAESTARSLADATSAAEHRNELAVKLETAQKELQAADRRLKRANEEGEPALLDRAGSLLAAADPQLKTVVESDRRIKVAERSLADATAELEELETRLEAAKQLRAASLGRSAEAAKILEEAEAALDRGRHADMAATLRAGLHLDEECPVCDQIVEELPDAVANPHLDELEEIVAAARSTKTQVDKAHTDSLTGLERAKSQVQAATERIAAIAGQVSGARTDATRARADLEETNLQLEKLLGTGDPEENLKVRRAAYDSLAREKDISQRRADQVRGEHDQAIRDEQNAAKIVQDLSVRLADLAARLEIDVAIEAEPGSVANALDVLRTGWQEAIAEAREEQQAAADETKSLSEEHSRLRDEVDVTGDVASAAAVVADRIQQLRSTIADDQAELDQSADVIRQSEELADRVDIFSRINSDLTDSRFIRFLLDDERARLAELGSEHFQRLSAGRYRFADDQFAILDLTAADSTRRADSLSGGETFLASLGLALALAEMVAGTGGRLDAFFLDEGFGTLDPEHLDLAMEGIETLIADRADRLVVIVSHVPELRERVEDLIELERNPVSGDTRVIRD